LNSRQRLVPTTETTPASDVITRLERLAAVRATGLLDTPAEPEFDRLTRLAAKLTGAPVTFVSLVAEDRDFYKSCFGFPEPLASERQLTGTTFCHFALVSKGPLVIENALDHPIYRDVPTVHTLGVRAYLGIPLVTHTGEAIGSFCAIDFKPRTWTPLDIEVMQELAESTLREIELRSALRALDNEQRRLNVLLQHIPVGVTFAEPPSGRIIMRNRKANDLIGDSASGSLPPDSYELLSEGSAVPPNEWPLMRAIRGEEVQGGEFQLVRKDGRRTWVRIDAAPVLGEDGQVLGGIAAFHDIDNQRALAMENARLYEAAQQANRAKDDFFATVSHELRTPMTSIIGWARLLRMEERESPDAIEAVDAIASSAQLQAQLIDDLLDVSRIATSKLSLRLERISLNEAVQASVTAAMPAADSKGVRLRTDLGPDVALDADRQRLRQIVGNILSNSIKFTPAGGLVSLATRADGGFASITVQDTGRGIDPPLLPYIFDRLRQERSAEQGGLGLGLAIVKHLAEAHGGDIRAESDGQGKGATFVVRLPLPNGS
jgi:PAS domain S-box-containing protein